ncbi:MAG: fatty-acyl-CoA synthase, partial [Nocardioidaceae bacterium]|nr:fatty-acyl-CoA synthase [Nocardioidaceae bacterium]
MVGVARAENTGDGTRAVTGRRPASRFTVDTVLQRNLPPSGAEPDRVALVFGDQRLTFENLERRSSSLAQGLLDSGFRHGDVVCVLAHNRAEWFELLFALAKIGGVIVPVNYLLKPKEVAYIVVDSGACWIVGDDALWPTVEAVLNEVATSLNLVTLDTDRAGAASYAALVSTSPGRPTPAVEADDLLLLQYTSGTTGFPKGAMHTHA